VARLNVPTVASAVRRPLAPLRLPRVAWASYSARLMRHARKLMLTNDPIGLSREENFHHGPDAQGLQAQQRVGTGKARFTLLRFLG
jgi:hypothetical protein